MESEPGVVRARMDALLIAVRSLWFPSMADARAWDASEAELYVRWTGPDTFVLGPKLFNMAAARFSPVLHASIRADDGGSVLVGRIRFPRMAGGLLGVWTALLVGWLGFGLYVSTQKDEPLGWLVFWALLAASLVVVWAVGLVQGGKALDEGLARFVVALADDGALEDDWG